VRLVDVTVALISAEIYRAIPQINVDFKEVSLLIKELGQRISHISLRFITALRDQIFGRKIPLSLQGRDALLDDKLIEDEIDDNFIDFDDVSSLGGTSTVATASENKRIADLETKLAEMQAMLNVLLQHNGGGGDSGIKNVSKSPPPPDPSGIPPVSNVAPPAPPPPPPFSSMSTTTIVKSHVKPVTKPVEVCADPVSTTLAESLRLIKTGQVQLRKIPRTPNGTPLRARPVSNPEGGLRGIFEAAIKKKFEHANSDDENVAEEEWDETDKL